MSLWTDIGKFLSGTTSEVFSSLAERVRTVFAGNAQKRRHVAFSIAIIALSAKMAKADGIVTEDEVEAFRQIFEVPEDEMANVARLFNLARQDVSGFDAYARQVKALFPDDQAVLRDVVDGLFHIAKADDMLHEKELAFIEHVAAVFEFEETTFKQILVRHMSVQGRDPYVLLGADPEWDFAHLKAHYRKRVADNHPDRLIARGVPPEFIAIATERLACLNTAWEQIELERKQVVPA